MTEKKTRHTPGPTMDGPTIVALVLNAADDYGVGLDDLGEQACNEIAAKIPLIAASPDLVAFVEDVEESLAPVDRPSIILSCEEAQRLVLAARALLAKVRA